MIKEIDSKPTVISRAGSSPADDAICGRVVVPDGEREATQRYQLRLKTAPVLRCRFLITGIEP